jgi:hypothetical protein
VGCFSFSHVKKYIEGKLPEADLAPDMAAKRKEESTSPDILLKTTNYCTGKQSYPSTFHCTGTVEVHWKIQRDENKGAYSEPAEIIEPWQSEMQFSFPVLGTVLVKLMLFGNNLTMQCSLPNGPSDALQKDLPLQSRLLNAGLNAQIRISESI